MWGVCLTFSMVCVTNLMFLGLGSLVLGECGKRSLVGPCGLCGLRVAGMEPVYDCVRAHVGLGFC